ncbi:putative receptor-like protein kinase [Capsicum baccatum]|uniref:Receptor-like protein kinase n=1 Tax=Capsicum baccatum TaxID=33114 RepID=A0A2G2WG75_CAPBA|nr:putative receptor-like protein kinase [Capsicum baccatum]
MGKGKRESTVAGRSFAAMGREEGKGVVRRSGEGSGAGEIRLTDVTISGVFPRRDSNKLRFLHTPNADTSYWKSINAATENFEDNFVIGHGGFGNVYKRYIDNSATIVSSKQGVCEFETEIHMLSKLRRLHLVSLIGYCDDNNEMILVYNYMAHGILRDQITCTELIMLLSVEETS